MQDFPIIMVFGLIVVCWYLFELVTYAFLSLWRMFVIFKVPFCIIKLITESIVVLVLLICCECYGTIELLFCLNDITKIYLLIPIHFV